MRVVLQHSTVDVIVPALNEASTIGLVIDEIPVSTLQSLGFLTRIVVIDNGSSDRTAQAALDRGAVVISEQQRGKGYAMRRGFSETQADYVVMLDGDATYPGSHIPEMLEVLQQGCHVVVGSRLKGTREPGAISRFNIFGNRMLTWFACLLYGRKTSDLCTGFWAFRGDVIPTLDLNSHGFTFEAELFSEVVRHHLRFAEVPIHYRRRPTPTKLQSLRDGYRIARLLLQRRFQRDERR